MGRRFWIILGVILIIGLAVFIFLILQNRAENEKAPENSLAMKETVQKSAESAGNELAEEPEKSSGSVNLIISESKGLEFKPFFEEEGKKIGENFLEQFSALANPPISAPKSASDKKEQSVASAPEATSTEIILSLTDDEFHFLYPDIFITSLMEAQNLFIKEYDPNYEPFLKIETDFQIRFVEKKIVSALLSANMITKEEAERYNTTIHFTLPQLQLTELKNRKSSSFYNFFQKNKEFCSISNFRKTNSGPSFQKGLFFAGLLDKLYGLIRPEAQAKVCGYCIYAPECFQVGAPNPVGFNVLKTFCYCTGCYHGQGCLDFCETMSAIWDPMTGICGCG